jgi:hypothetical protein
MQDALTKSPLYAAPLRQMNILRKTQAAPVDIYRTPDEKLVPVFRKVAGIARFLASIDILSAYIQRKWLYSREQDDILDPWWEARVSEVLEQKRFEIPGPVDPRAFFNWQEMLQRVGQVLVSKVVSRDGSVTYAPPLLWSWTLGGAGCFMVEETSQRGAVDRKLNCCLFLYDGESGGSARTPSLELLLSAYYFNNPEVEPQRRLLNLPGEFLLYHGDPTKQDSSMPIQQWTDLCAQEKQWTITVGPTKTGKYARYGLISWLDGQHRCYELDWRDTKPTLYRHRLDSYETTKWIDGADLKQPPFVSRWRKL